MDGKGIECRFVLRINMGSLRMRTSSAMREPLDVAIVEDCPRVSAHLSVFLVNFETCRQCE